MIKVQHANTYMHLALNFYFAMHGFSMLKSYNHIGVFVEINLNICRYNKCILVVIFIYALIFNIISLRCNEKPLKNYLEITHTI